MSCKPDITVVLTTYNNCLELRTTLQGFADTDRGGVEVEMVVVDNNSTDATQAVVKEFAGRLRVRALHEARQGKCAALNRALDTLTFGSIVFFTDDDVDVPRDLFQQVSACAQRNPGSSVFGGCVYLGWPPGNTPPWAKGLADSFRAYSHLDLGDKERPFPPLESPVGTNWWVRREVLAKGYRFDERIGPGVRRCPVGDETAFLLRMARDGYSIIYAPAVRVGHRVAPRLLMESVIMRRGLATGKAGALLAYEYGFGQGRYIKSRPGWMLLRTACLLRWAIWYAAASFAWEKTQRVCRRWDSLQGIGWNLEALRLASEPESQCKKQPAQLAGSCQSGPCSRAEVSQ